MQVFSKSLHRKILILILFVSVIPAFAGILQVYWGSLIAVNNVIGEYCETQTSKLSAHLGTLLDNKRKALMTLKEKSGFLYIIEVGVNPRTDHVSKDKINSEMLHNLVVNTDIASDKIFISTINGEPILSSGNYSPPDFSNKKWWHDIAYYLDTETYFAEVNDFEAGDVRLFLCTPVYMNNQDEPSAILSIEINKSKLLEKLDAMQGGEGLFFTLYSRNGYFLSNYPDNGKLKKILDENYKTLGERLTGYFLSKSQDEENNIIVFTSIPQLKMWYNEGRSNCSWLVISTFETGKIVTFVNILLWRTSIFGGIIFIIICILALLVSNRIVRPIKELRKASHLLAAGNLDYRVNVKTNDELELLADTFNEMAERLQITYDDLATKLMEIDGKAKQITLIHEITKAISAAMNLEQIYKILFKETSKVLVFDRLMIAFIEEGIEIKVRIDYIAPGDSLIHFRGQKIPLDQTIYIDVLKRNSPVLIEDLKKSDLHFEDEILLYENFKSCMIIPLRTQMKIIGFFSLESKNKNTYSTKDVDVLSQIGDALSVAVEHSSLYLKISKFAEELEVKIKERTRELENAQMKLVQTEKLAATGELSANLAHEINNPLGIIKNYIRMITDMLKATPEESLSPENREILDNLQVVKEELDRIARIVRNLLNFYKVPDMQKVRCDINGEIKQLLVLMENGFKKKKISVDAHLDDKLPQIKLPQDSIKQVILNLLRNAEDAMENGGELTIITRYTKLRIGETGSGRIYISIKDTGCGIPYHNISRIFDPFFTTKKEKGTGLGLSVSYGLIRGMGGAIDVDSVVNKGTTFKISIPVEEKDI